VPTEDHADIVGMARSHLAKLQAEIEARPLPRQEPELTAENFAGQTLGVD
jgi:hypothetical protein